MAVMGSLAVLCLAASALARTDLQGCTYTDAVMRPPGDVAYETRVWYVPGSDEVCEPLDCGGGRAPPKTTVPGCPLYRGAATYTPRFLDVGARAGGQQQRQGGSHDGGAGDDDDGGPADDGQERGRGRGRACGVGEGRAGRLGGAAHERGAVDGRRGGGHEPAVTGWRRIEAAAHARACMGFCRAQVTTMMGGGSSRGAGCGAAGRRSRNTSRPFAAIPIISSTDRCQWVTKNSA